MPDPERLTGGSPAPTLPDRGEPALAPRTVFGLLVVVFGGVVLSQSLLGLPFLFAGAWLTTGRGLPELRRRLAETRGDLLGWVLGGAFFVGAILQASVALLPIVPLFAISALLLPPTRRAAFSLTGRPLPPPLRELLIVALLCSYGYLVAFHLAAKADDRTPAHARILPQR